MRFIFNLTRREIRSSWRRLLFFFLCIALGVGSVVALRSLIQNLTNAVGTDARLLMTADVELSSTADFAPAEVAKIEGIIGRYGIVDARTETITSAVMARPVDVANERVKFIELKGIEPAFPLVGEFQLSDSKPFNFDLLESGGAVVSRILLEDLNLNIGDKVNIGEAQFTIRGTLDEEPGGTGGFRLGPRVFVEKKAFDTAGVTRNNGRVRRRQLLRTVSDPTPMVKELREAMKGSTITVNSYREQQENLGEQFARTENYLSLTGLLILVLGGVGVFNVARAFVEQRRKTVAVLKCLGASGTKVITVYLLQILILGLAGSLLGVVFAQLALLAVRWQLADSLPAKMTYGVGVRTVATGIILGVFISLLFSALPLLQIRTIKPKLLLRDENSGSLTKLDPLKWFVAIMSIAMLLGIAVWQAGSWIVGAVFLVGLGTATLVLYLSATVLVWVIRRFRSFGPFAFRQGLNSLYRPGNQTRIVLLAIGLGTFVVLGVDSVRSNLIREFDFTNNQRLPSLFFVDIQRGQIDELAQIVATRTGEEPETIPTVRARISHVNGVAPDYQNREVRQQQGQIGREFAVTYREDVDENEKILKGSWWTDENVAQVSVETTMAERLKVSPDDSITFDISGRQITARVVGIREIDARKTRTAFVFVFKPGTLDAAPRSYGASVLKHIPATERQRLQRELLDKFPNVQIFDVDDILNTVKRLIDNFVLAISFVGGFVILSGVLILIGSIALTRSQRIYENAVLKTLGARRNMLATILTAEYSIVGLLAGVIGAAFGTALSWTVCRFVMDIKWEFDWRGPLVGVIATTLLVTIVGVVTSFDVIFKKPLATLRSQ